MAVSTAQDVASFFVSSFQKAGDPVTNLKLQKLLYYAQGWYLAFTQSPLFEERIEAWAISFHVGWPKDNPKNEIDR